MQLTWPSNSLTLLAYKFITPYTPNSLKTISNKVEDEFSMEIGLLFLNLS